MSEELLSALLDGECTPAEVEAALAAIERSPALKARWTRMCLTRDALAGVAIRKPTIDLTAGIMAALDDQPAADTHPKVVPLRPRAVSTPAAAPMPAAAVSARSLRWQRFAGLAVAASITAVVAIGGRNLLDQPIDGGAGSQPLATAAVATNLVKVSADGQLSGVVPVDVASEDSPGWENLDAETKRQLNDYLIQHSTRGADAGMGGSLGYPRLVAQQASYRPADGSR